MRHKIVLYNPRAVFYTMPLALIAVGSALDPTKYDVRIIDGRLEADPVRRVLAEIDDALCLGVTVLTGAPIQDALRLSRAAKARRSDLPIVWGGWHPSLFPEQCLEEPSVDVTVIGQGEETFAEIVGRLAAGTDLTGVAGCAVTSRLMHHASRTSASGAPSTSNLQPPNPLSGIFDRQPATSPPRPLRDLNQLPAHNYDLVPVERYFALKGKRQIDYISSQGCRFRCSFCADPYVYKRGWTGLAPERMGAEIEALWQRYRFVELSFQDETFFTRRERVAAIAEEFITRRLDFAWTGTLRADQGFRLPDEVLARCRRAGLRRVMVGMESGSQAILDWIKKDITLEQVWDTADKCRRHGIAMTINIIVGFPGEPEESVAESLAIAKQLRAMSPDFELAIFFYKPYPGNEIADRLLREGYHLPQTLEEWAHFDYIGSSGPWVTPEKRQLVERFKFYQRFAFGRNGHPLRRPLQLTARWRIARDFYAFPIEKAVVERLKPPLRVA